MFDRYTKNFREKPFATISGTVAFAVGVVGLITAGNQAAEHVGEYFVSAAELEIAKTEVISVIRKEAIITRNVIVGEILVRKSELQRELEDTKDAGRISSILEDITVLNHRLNKIRGIDE